MRVLVASLAMIVVLPLSASAQTWSPEQQEVWRAVQGCWAHFANENLDAALACHHKDFSGWLYGEPVPRDLNTTRTMVPYFFETRNTRAYELRPIAIRVHGNVAVIHYFYTEIQQLADGSENIEQGRWTDIMLKQDGKWVWIADHGGPRP